MTGLPLPIFNPYDIDLPAVISFSGGRTSGYMLRHILDAKGGQPEGLRVCFQNTGLEHEKTLEFVRQCETNWGVRMDWLEFDLDEEGGYAVKVVDFETASRKGEPFTKLIELKKYLPNPVSRICTVQLKIRTLYRHLKDLPGFEEGWLNAVGLRADEPWRVHRLKPDDSKSDTTCPLYYADVTQPMVDAWWKEQPFNLDLPLGGNIAGNCVGCFLKSAHKIESLMRTMPEHFDWWQKAEEIKLKTDGDGNRFRTDRMSYKDFMVATKRQPALFDYDSGDSIPCMCTD